MKIYVAGNCQAGTLAQLLELGTSIPVERLQRKHDEELDKEHIIFCQPGVSHLMTGNVVLFPQIVMTGFYPDMLSGEQTGGINTPLRNLSSSIVLKAWCESLNVQNTAALFNNSIYERLGFFDHFEISRGELFAQCREADFPIGDYYDAWMAKGCFMHTFHHPKLLVMLDIAKHLTARTGIDWNESMEFDDPQSRGCGWPFYPELAERAGMKGSYEFRKHIQDGGEVLDLEAFINQSFERYALQSIPRTPTCSRLQSTRYANLRATLPAKVRGVHPYTGLPDHQFWRKSAGDDLDPVTKSFTICPDTKVATAGSCFAQHMSRALAANGLNYFVAEKDPGTGGANYGVFSARYGNIYTAKQLVQLFDRAYGKFQPKDTCWRRRARFFDPFRPGIEPDGFASVRELRLSRRDHFTAVRQMFQQLDVFVFTLGLTEAWRAKSDGAVFPLAPGVSAGVFNPELHEFVNFGVAEVIQDLNDFLRRLARVNRKARVILTVSPVPLAATFEPAHVLVSTTYSKSVLRVAAEEVARTHRRVTYFPSYEIITGNFNRGRYFGADLRSVTPTGVDHVMRVFLRHFTVDREIAAEVREALEIVCEEERLLDRGGVKTVPSAVRPATARKPRAPAAKPPVPPVWQWLRNRLRRKPGKSVRAA
ncbi:MAG TPA: GSCFA domain-containing protein [Rhizomicrobium sp.]|jgi:hypothetical protein|nr:GSCFA domain-containing protein [Rhizomicrobium sp.]